MRPMIKLALACAAFVQQAALGETLRCGAVLIQPGDDARYVLEKCGEARSLTTIVQPALVSGITDNVYQIGFTPSRWLITREPGQFRAVLTIGADGRVETIAFERRRGGD